MINPTEKEKGFQGRCDCKWAGPWRATDTDAAADARQHAKETGCPTAKPPEPDDLMPYERRKLHND